MNISKIKSIEAITILSIVMANKIIFSIPRSIICSTGSSAWINSMYIVFISFLFVLFVIRLFKNFPNMDILDISDYLGGKKFKGFIGLIYIILFLLTINTVIRNFSQTLENVYFKQSPMLFIILFLVIASCVANKFGLKSIAKASAFITPIVFISLLVVLFSPIKNFVLQRFFPILGYGVNATFFSGLSNIFALSGIGYIFLLPTLLRDSVCLKKISIISLTISGIFLILSVCCMLLVFSFISDTNENMSLYLITMISNHNDLIHGVNTIFLLVWILSVISYISIGVFFILFVIQKISNLSKTISANYCITSILVGMSVHLQNYAQFTAFFEDTFKYVVLIFVFFINPIILVLANLKQKKLLFNTRKDLKGSSA